MSDETRDTQRERLLAELAAIEHEEAQVHEGAVDEAVETVEDAVEEATDTVSETVNEQVDTAEETVDETVEEAVEVAAEKSPYFDRDNPDDIETLRNIVREELTPVEPVATDTETTEAPVEADTPPRNEHWFYRRIGKR